MENFNEWLNIWKTNGNVLGGGFKHFVVLSLSGEDEPNFDEHKYSFDQL